MSETNSTAASLSSDLVRVPAESVPYLEGKVADMAKRAKRTGKPTPSIEVVATGISKVSKGFNAFGEEVFADYAWADVRVHGERPVLAGWTIVANLVKLTEEVNVIRAIEGSDGEELEAYRHRTNVCDHCGTARRRNETWLFRNDETGELRQVARSCCKDFVGCTDIDLARMVSWSTFVGNLMDPDFMGSARMRGSENIVDFLTATAASVRVHGWTPKSRATEGRPATVGTVGAILRAQARPNDKYEGVLPVGPHPAIIPEDYQAAQAALAWMRTEAHATDRSDYIRNCYHACSVDYTLPKTEGLVASVVGAAYPNFLKRAKETEAKEAAREERKEATKASEHQGAVKERLTFNATLIRFKCWEGDWGPTSLHVFQDDEGNVYQWYASGEHDREEGARYAVKGTVKRHGTDRYTGNKVTILTRCALKGA